MYKDEIIKFYNEQISLVKTYKDGSKFYKPANLKELIKCPMCHTYEGDGYRFDNFLYSFESCKCGYNKEEK